MSMADWPALERPREKLLALGAGALSDAELLAIFLRTGLRDKPVLQLYIASLPFIAILLLALAIITYLPWLSLVLIG